MLRASAWAAPVILTIAAAPAFAVSAGPLTIVANEATGASKNNHVRLTFTGGTGNVTVATVLRNGAAIDMTGTQTVSAANGHVDGDKKTYTEGASYTVSYVYHNINYVKTVIAT